MSLIPKTDSSANTHLAEILFGALFLSMAAPIVKGIDVAATPAAVYRMAIGTVTLWGYNAWQNNTAFEDLTYALRFVPAAAFFSIDLFMWHKCIHYVGPGLATILANLQVFIMAGIGYLWFEEKLGWRFFTGLFLAFPGVVGLVGVDLSALSSQYLLGLGLGLGAAATYSGYLLAFRAQGQQTDSLKPAVNLMYVTFWCTLFLAGLSLVEGTTFGVGGYPSWIALLAYGILVQVLAWIFISRAMPNLPASIIGLFLLLQPTLAMVWDITLFGRPTGVFDAIGMVLVLLGIYLASSRPSS